MTVVIKKAERSQSKLRIGLAGPSGSGKTMSSLKLARGLVGPAGKICLIDTERGSAQLYAHVTDFDVIEIKAPFAPKKYIEAIEAAEDAKYDVIIIDSLSHAWTDEGGILDQADKLEKAGKNRFTMWADLTPQHRMLVNAMLNTDAHLIGCVRSKQEYALDKDAQTGKSTVKKLGMAPIQREGMEYEFTVFIDIAQNHVAQTSKDRTDLFRNEVWTITEETGERLITWLNSAKAPEVAAQSNSDKRMNQKKQRIMNALKKLGVDSKDLPTLQAVVKAKTELELTPENYDDITSRLELLVSEMPIEGRGGAGPEGGAPGAGASGAPVATQQAEPAK